MQALRISQDLELRARSLELARIFDAGWKAYPRDVASLRYSNPYRFDVEPEDFGAWDKGWAARELAFVILDGAPALTDCLVGRLRP